MSDNPENLACRAVPAQAALAPVAAPAGEVDFPDNTTPHQPRIIRLNNFTNELVPRCARETVVPAEKLDVGVADAAAQQPDHRVTLWPTGFGDFSYRCATLFKVDRDHAG